MRTLTATQKKLLKEWFKNNYPHNTGYYKFDLADKIDYDTYEKIEAIHPTEIHYQNVNNYLESLV
jgi:hypothetical protein